MKRVRNNEVIWEVEVNRIELNEDEYSEKIVRLIKALLEIDQSQKQAEIDSRKSVDQNPRKAA